MVLGWNTEVLFEHHRNIEYLTMGLEVHSRLMILHVLMQQSLETIAPSNQSTCAYHLRSMLAQYDPKYPIMAPFCQRQRL